MIYSLGNLRNTVQKLVVNNTFTTSIASILQCDVIHKNNVEGSEVRIQFFFIVLIIKYFFVGVVRVGRSGFK